MSFVFVIGRQGAEKSGLPAEEQLNYINKEQVTESAPHIINFCQRNGSLNLMYYVRQNF